MCTTRRSALEERMPRTSTGSAGVTKSITSMVVPWRSAVVRSTDAPLSYDCVHEHGASSSQWVSPSRSSPRRSSPRCWPWSTFGQKRRSISPRSLIVASSEPLPRIAAGRNAYRRPGLVERSRDVRLDRHQRSLTVTTGEVETEPSLARATATNETDCPRRKSRGSTKTPYGAPSSVPMRAQLLPGSLDRERHAERVDGGRGRRDADEIREAVGS